MIPSNVLQRTHRISFATSEGTCFTVDHQRKQYIVTARHVIEGFKDQDTLNIYHERRWKALNCRRVGMVPDTIDVAVLAAFQVISPPHALPMTGGHMVLGQEAYFLGFPYGLTTEIGAMNNNWPLPLVKRACISSMIFDEAKLDYILLDGHNNPGFSGGPVVYCPPGRFDDFRVAGVVSGYRYDWSPVFAKGTKTDLFVQSNTGIVIAHAIRYALELIEANPIGAPIE